MMKPLTSSLWTRKLGAACGLKEDVRGKTSKLLPKKAGVGLVAANGTPIEHHGQRQVRFRGCLNELDFSQAEVSRPVLCGPHRKTEQ